MLEIDRKLHHGELPETVVEFGENIKMTEGPQSLTVEYEQISKIYRFILSKCSRVKAIENRR